MTDEPTFRIEIRACSWNKLSMVELTRKLKLMHDLNFDKFYTIIEDTKETYDVKKPPLPT